MRINRTKGPLRVWLKDQEAPGLAMTRSIGNSLIFYSYLFYIGDHIARKVGVIATPEIFSQDITGPSALVIGSDGLFEFSNNYDIAMKVFEDWSSLNAINSTEDLTEVEDNFELNSRIANETARDLVESSHKQWKSKQQSHIDDIS